MKLSLPFLLKLPLVRSLSSQSPGDLIKSEFSLQVPEFILFSYQRHQTSVKGISPNSISMSKPLVVIKFTINLIMSVLDSSSFISFFSYFGPHSRHPSVTNLRSFLPTYEFPPSLPYFSFSLLLGTLSSRSKYFSHLISESLFSQEIRTVSPESD